MRDVIKGEFGIWATTFLVHILDTFIEKTWK